jgi:pyrimidine operon attenuation protein/uracil phosphoribosyltransferase
MASQVIADTADPTTLTVVGILSHGAMLAMRLRDMIEARIGVRPPCAALDVYGRDAVLQAVDGAASFEVDGRAIVLVDDVISSGWTVQRALTALWRHGRPAAVRLAVLIDRGHRALPIRPNYVGKSIPTAQADRVQVRLGAHSDDGGRKPADRVLLYTMIESFKGFENVR